MTNLIFTVLLLATTPTATHNQPSSYFFCEPNDPHESLESCIHDCEVIHRKRQPNYTETVEKMRYKVVQLTEFEYEFNSTGHLVSDLPNPISGHSFVLDDHKNVFVCYPLDEDFVNCTNKWRLSENEFQLHDNLRQLIYTRQNTSYPVGKFYLDFYMDEWQAAVCKPDAPLAKKTSIDYMFLAAYAISVVGLALTFVLAIVVPELNIRNNFILLCHLAAMTLAYVLLLLRSVMTRSATTTGCLMLASLQQFSVLASFFWINVQAIDLFSRFVHLRGSRDVRTSTRRFVCYCMYAWGCPMVICLVTLGMEKTDAQSFKANFRMLCWFSKKDSSSLLLYLYGPISVILFVNCVLFVLTVSKLCKVGKTAGNVNKNMHNQLQSQTTELLSFSLPTVGKEEIINKRPSSVEGFGLGKEKIINKRPSSVEGFSRMACLINESRFSDFTLVKPRDETMAPKHNLQLSGSVLRIPNRLQLYLKLAFVMGLFWVMEVVAWAVGGDERNWYFTELVNSLQGLFIFIIYVCKPSYIRRIVYKKSFFPNRPNWWPWKTDSRRKSDQEDHDGTKMHESLSATTSLAVNESVQPNTNNI